jgi:hypothetical protein
MAILKDFQTEFGVTANYHRLVKIEVDSNKQLVQLTVGIYISEEARNQGGNPLWYEYVRVPFDRLNFDPRDIFYPLLKDYNLSYLTNGVDIIPSDGTVHPPVFEIVEPPPPAPPPLPPGF